MDVVDPSFRLLPDQASTLAPKLDLLGVYLLGVTVFFTLLIAVLVGYFAIKYHRRPKDIHLPNPPDIHTSSALEVIWCGIPLVLVMVMFVWGAKLYIEESRPPVGAQEVYVTGKQWMWKFQHADGRREINELTVPIGRPIKLVMTSQDVIHDVFIPAFRVKQDVLPGRYSYEWFTATRPGAYHLFCAEYCGTQHSGMTGVVHVLNAADYQRWLDGTKPAADPEVGGLDLYMHVYHCDYCHGIRAPSLYGLYGSEIPVMVGDKRIMVKADEDYLRESIIYPRAKIAIDTNTNLPYPAELMPGYANQMSEEQVSQLIAFIKSVGKDYKPGAGGERIDPGSRMREENPPAVDQSSHSANQLNNDH